MLRKRLRQLIPTRARIKEIKLHDRLGTWIYRPSLWHINRHSVSMAIFVGLSIAFVPAPGQTLLAVTCEYCKKEYQITAEDLNENPYVIN